MQDGWHEATETEKQLILYSQLDLKHLLDFNNYDIQVSYVQQMYVLAPFLTVMIFRLDALALSVIATATWLAGWLAGCPSHSGTVSKWLNLSENFFDHLKAPSF